MGKPIKAVLLFINRWNKNLSIATEKQNSISNKFQKKTP